MKNKRLIVVVAIASYCLFLVVSSPVSACLARVDHLYFKTDFKDIDAIYYGVIEKVETSDFFMGAFSDTTLPHDITVKVLSTIKGNPPKKLVSLTAQGGCGVPAPKVGTKGVFLRIDDYFIATAYEFDSGHYNCAIYRLKKHFPMQFLDAEDHFCF